MIHQVLVHKMILFAEVAHHVLNNLIVLHVLLWYKLRLDYFFIMPSTVYVFIATASRAYHWHTTLRIWTVLVFVYLYWKWYSWLFLTVWWEEALTFFAKIVHVLPKADKWLRRPARESVLLTSILALSPIFKSSLAHVVSNKLGHHSVLLWNLHFYSGLIFLNGKYRLSISWKMILNSFFFIINNLNFHIFVVIIIWTSLIRKLVTTFASHKSFFENLHEGFSIFYIVFLLFLVRIFYLLYEF